MGFAGIPTQEGPCINMAYTWTPSRALCDLHGPSGLIRTDPSSMVPDKIRKMFREMIAQKGWGGGCFGLFWGARMFCFCRCKLVRTEKVVGLITPEPEVLG